MQWLCNIFGCHCNVKYVQNLPGEENLMRWLQEISSTRRCVHELWTWMLNVNMNRWTLLNWDANFLHPASLCQSMHLPPPCCPTTHFTAAPHPLSTKVSKQQDYLHSGGQCNVLAHVYNLLTMYLEQKNIIIFHNGCTSLGRSMSLPHSILPQWWLPTTHGASLCIFVCWRSVTKAFA